MRQQPCFGEEFEVVGELLRHFVQIPSQVVLPGYLVHAWEVVDLLVGAHLLPLVQGGSHVSEDDVPVHIGVPRLFLTDFPSKVLLAHLLNDIISSVVNVEGKPRRFDHNGRRWLLLLGLFLPLLALAPFFVRRAACFWFFLTVMLI